MGHQRHLKWLKVVLLCVRFPHQRLNSWLIVVEQNVV